MRLLLPGMKDERINQNQEDWDNGVAIYATCSLRLFKIVQRVDATHAFFRDVLTGHGCFCAEGGVVSHNVAQHGN